MKRVFCTALSCLLFTALAFSHSTLPPDDIIAFVNVSVIPMDSERVLEGQTVVVQGERIVTLGPSSEVEVPDGATTIDGSGKYLMPGLAEMHGHIPPPNQPAQYIEDVLFLYAANGITTVRGMLGHPGQLELREKANNREVISPTLYLAGPSFNGQSINSPEQAIERVRRQKEEGWDLLKIHPGLTMEEYDAMAKTAHEVGIRFGGHVPADVGLLHALEMGQETFDHIDGYIAYMNGDEGPVTDQQLADVVERTKAAGAWVVPTMALWEVLFGTLEMEEVEAYDELKYMPPQQRNGWLNNHRQRLNSSQLNMAVSETVIENRMRLLGALHEGGARILMGTDAPQLFSVPGFSLHRELERMVEVGMSPYAIIESGSKIVGEYFADQDTFGIIAEGQRADMILVNANPLEDVSHIQQRTGVMVRGQWLSEEMIQERFKEIEARNAGDS